MPDHWARIRLGAIATWRLWCERSRIATDTLLLSQPELYVAAKIQTSLGWVLRTFWGYFTVHVSEQLKPLLNTQMKASSFSPYCLVFSWRRVASSTGFMQWDPTGPAVVRDGVHLRRVWVRLLCWKGTHHCPRRPPWQYHKLVSCSISFIQPAPWVQNLHYFRKLSRAYGSTNGTLGKAG